ncbi:HTH-type transcriptional regulator MalT [Baekduia alba]|uniref:LuxR C-terminal-related transcriptional regulator n=1 Tax=Baekduia alba TaxID=2997333 RepID=UPI0023409166|nr:LuxR C-terminal-related transcriptional regulator [Baekduia alba]WCB94650.1 HTH-type transcriptional regulator MalT [Baekduia alba]
MDVALAPAGSVVAPTKLCVPDGDGASPPPRRAYAPGRLQAASTARLALVDGRGARALAAGDGRPVAWLALDPEDADPVRLWRCAIAALRVLRPGFGVDAEAMLAAGPAALTDAVVPLVAAEAATLPEAIMVVLDRCGALGERAAEALPSLTTWLARAPEGSLLVVADAPPAVAAALRDAAGEHATLALDGTVAEADAGATPRTAGTPSARFDGALAAREPATAAAIVAAVWPATLARGEQATVQAWLHELPPKVAAAEPDLFLVRLWATLERGALSTAERQLAEPRVAPELRARGRLLHANDALRRGDLPALAARIEAAAQDDPADGYWHTADALLRAHEALWRGHPRVAHRHFARAAGLAHRHGDRYALTAALGYLALLAAEGGDDDAARRRLGRLEDLADADPAVAEHPVAIGGALAEGRLLELAGALESSVAPLGRAIALARRGGSRFERAEPRLRLGAVHRACQRPELADVLEAEALEILAGCPATGGRLAGRATAVAPATARRDALSPSERAVLRMLPSGLSQREIGAGLFLSVNTVKTHCRNIYTKLGAQSRDEAVARAHQQGLL